MQKKLIALAIAAAFSAPAFADNANVNLYGKAFLTFDSVGSNQANAVTTQRIKSQASRFGIKGSEDIGDGLKAIYQYEVEMGADGGTASPAGSGVGGFGKSRNSGVGLAGDFGQVIMGVWDSPYKVVHNKIELFDNTTSFDQLNIIGQTGSADKAYNNRYSNMIQYWSPSLGGVKLAVMYSPDGTKTATKNATILSMSAAYDVEALYVGLGYEKKNDEVVGTSDSAVRLVGKYDFGGAWVGATAESIKVNTSLTANYTKKNLELVGGVKLDASTIALSYAKAGNNGSATNTGAKQITLRYGYNFSKRTELFAAYTSLKNDSATSAYNAIYGAATTAGATETALGFGLIHSF